MDNYLGNYAKPSQIQEKHFGDIDFVAASKILLTGYFFKTVIADNLNDYTFWMAYPYFWEQSSLTLVAMMYGYSAQIFADFAGYSLIAIGIAKLFGYHLPDNFNFPYISKSFSEFWRRWHMSLSSWLKDYLYIPLGGNRRGRVRTYINLIVVMLLGGLWHGAAWNYLFWGGVHGVLLAVERFARETLNNMGFLVVCDRHRILHIVYAFFVFTMVSWAWLFFKLPNFDYAIEYTVAIFHNASLAPNKSVMIYVCAYMLPIFAYHMNYLLPSVKSVSEHGMIAYALMLFLILCNGGNSNAFIYFQF